MASALADVDQDDRCGGDTADRLDLARGDVIGGRRAVQDHLGRGLGQLSTRLGGIGGRPHQLDVGVIGEALANLGQPVAAPVMKTLIGDMLIDRYPP